MKKKIKYLPMGPSYFECSYVGKAIAVVMLSLVLLTAKDAASADPPIVIYPLVDETGKPDDMVLETFLSPRAFSNRRFVFIQSAQPDLLNKPELSIVLNPKNNLWPTIAGLPLTFLSTPIELTFMDREQKKIALKEGIAFRWTVAPIGQRFEPSPHFLGTITGVEVFNATNGAVLMTWQAEAKPPICRLKVDDDTPTCTLKTISRETVALSVNQEGTLLSLAIGGLRPRIEMYDIAKTPQLLWQSLFPQTTGGPVSTSFSADGRWVVALSGNGAMHRFDAVTGGLHLKIPSKGQTATSIPPGRLIAVGGLDGQVKLWYLSDGTIAWHLNGREFRGRINSISVSGDGRRFATLEYSGEQTIVRVWDIQRRSLLSEIYVASVSIADIALNNSGDTLFVSHEAKGLLSFAVKKNPGEAKPFGQDQGAQCKGKLQWIPLSRQLICSMSNGVSLFNNKGDLVRFLKTGTKVTGTKIGASASGFQIVAVGSGSLWIWRNEYF